MKQCNICKEPFPATDEYFHKDKSRKDGLRDCCKKCNCDKTNRYRLLHLEEIQIKKRLYAEENPEHVKELKHAEYERHTDYYIQKSAEYRKEHPDWNRDYQREWAREARKENPELFNQRAKEWRANNPERDATNRRIWVENNRDHICELRRQRYNENPGIAAAKYHRRRALKLALPTDFTKEDWRYALQYWAGTCAICGKQDGLFSLVVSMDHWIPLVSTDCPGHIPHNILPLCFGIGGCNSSKGGKEPSAWLLERLGKRKAQQKLKEIERFFATVRKVPP